MASTTKGTRVHEANLGYFVSFVVKSFLSRTNEPPTLVGLHGPRPGGMIRVYFAPKKFFHLFSLGLRTSRRRKITGSLR